MVDCWPIGIGAPCVGCTERNVAFKVPIFQTTPIHGAVPPASYPPVDAGSGQIDPVATGLVGLGLGALAGGTYVAAKRFSKQRDDERVPEGTPDKGGPATEGAKQ